MEQSSGSHQRPVLELSKRAIVDPYGSLAQPGFESC